MTSSTPIKEPDCINVKIVVIYLKKKRCDLLQNQCTDQGEGDSRIEI